MRPIERRRELIGRGPELAALRGAVDTVGRGVGGTVLLVGEAGIGKSRLLAEVEARARTAGMEVLTGRAVPGGGTYRAVAAALAARLRDEELSAEWLGPYGSALRRLVPGWAAAAPEPEPTVDPVLVLGEGVLRLLRRLAGDRGCVLLLDDMRWADADSLALVEYLAAVVPSAPVLLAVAARDEGPTAPTIARLAATREVHAMRLDRLSAGEVAALAAVCRGGVPVGQGVLDMLSRSAEGLPYLVEELVAGAEDGGAAVPPTLAALVAERLGGLSDPAREVVRAAAVLGTDPEWGLLGAITGQPDAAGAAALRAATQAQLFAPEAERLRWRHALTRDAVSATLLPLERAAIARKAAEVLLARGHADDETQAAELLALAGEAVRAAALFRTLARRDLSRGALRSAERFLERTSAEASIGGSALAHAVLCDRIRLLTLTGRADTALDIGSTALTTSTGDDHAELCLLLARTAVAEAGWDRAQDYLQEAGRPDDPRALALAAEVAFGRGELDRAAEIAASATVRAEQATERRQPGAAETLCDALRITALCALWRLDVAAGAAATRQTAQTAAENGLLSHRVEALIGLALVESIEHAAEPLGRARDLALEAGLLAHVARVDLLLAFVAFTADGPATAEPIARRCADLAATLRLTWCQAPAEVLVANCRAVAGDLDGMRRFLADAVERPQCPVEFAGFATVVRAFPALFSGDLERAAVLADEGMATVVAHRASAPMFYWGLWVLLRAAVGDRAEAAQESLRSNFAVHRPVNRAALRYAQAIVAGRAGQPSEAWRLFEEADSTAAGLDWWRRVLRMVALHGAVADGWGEPVAALRADLAEYGRNGDHQLARTCRDLLRRAGAPARTGRGQTPVPPRLRAFGVTSREMDVLTLVLDGLSNAQVAERLFLSPRTVETHVANLLAKTGASSRTELRERAGTPTP